MNVKKGKWFFVALALAMIVAMVPAVGGANTNGSVEWTGQGTDSLNCEEYEEGTMHWVLTQAGDVENPYLVLYDNDGIELERDEDPRMTGPVYHFYTEYYDLDNLQATIYFDGELAQNRAGRITSQFVLSGYCPGEEPCIPASIIYGVVGSGGAGGLWEIEFTETGIVETLLINYNLSGDTYSGNGLAFDEENNRLYFATTSGSKSNLYFYDFDGNIVTAGTELPGTIYGATWGAGQYWYIPNGSNDMRVVSFDGDGFVDSTVIFESNFAGGKTFNFGDIALDAEALVIYGSTSFSGTNKEFFKYDLTKGDGGRYSLITTDASDKAIGLQLAFGEDGVLYGHNTFGQNPMVTVNAKEFFEVDKAGTATSLGIGENAYNDLASGPSICD